MTVLPMHTEVQLDDDAIAAERRALLAELAAERYGTLQMHRTRAPFPKEVEAARHLRRAAALAREIAEQERCRCASRSCCPAVLEVTG
jgi:hypothetical protein